MGRLGAGAKSLCRKSLCAFSVPYSSKAAGFLSLPGEGSQTGSCLVQKELESGNSSGASLQTQPQHWIQFLDPLGARSLSGTGLGFGTLKRRATSSQYQHWIKYLLKCAWCIAKTVGFTRGVCKNRGFH